MHAIIRLILLSTALLASAATATAEPRIALVIGNSAYTGNAWRPLKNPANDARLMKATLEQVGFKVTMLIDADEAKMDRAIKDLGIALGEAGSNSVGLFYYSGHGVQVGGYNYVIPIDTRAQLEQDVTRQAIRLGDIQTRMGNGGAKLNFIILDACRSNALQSATRNQGGLARPDSQSNKFFLAFSTSPGTTASDGSGNNSPYTAALAEALKTPGLEAYGAFRSAAQTMSRTAPGQTPFVETGVIEDFCFRGCGNSGPSVPPKQASISASAPVDPAPAANPDAVRPPSMAPGAAKVASPQIIVDTTIFDISRRQANGIGGLVAGGNDGRNAVVGAAVGSLKGAAIGRFMDGLEFELRRTLKNTNAQVARRKDLVGLSLPVDALFDPGSSALKSETILAAVVKSLNLYPQTKIDISGHTDLAGKDGLDISYRQAEAVRGFLSSNSVLPSRMATAGFGATDPIVSNTSEYNRAGNRRIQIVLTPVTN